MARDRSLDEFATDDAGDPAETEQRGSADAEEHAPEADEGERDESGDVEADESGDAEPDESGDAEPDEPDDPIQDSEIDPAATTYQWDPAGVDCADCGRSVDRLWVQEDERVCPDCKEW